MMNSVMMLKSCPPVRPARFSTRTIKPRQMPRLARLPVKSVQTPERRSGDKAAAADNDLAGVGGYLMDGVASIFSPMQSSVPWVEPTGYTGSVTHHDVTRLRKLHSTLVDVREQIMGCTDPAAVNYSAEANKDDGTCEYIDLLDRSDVGHDDESNSLYGAVVAAVSRVFGSNFKTGQEPESWDTADHTGYAGRVSRRGRREVSRMLKFEALVKQTLEEAEKKVDRK